MKTIYLEISGKPHSLYQKLIDHPPLGYKIIDNIGFWDNYSRNVAKSNRIYTFQESILNKYVPANLIKAKIETLKKIPKNIDLTYSAGHLIFRKEFWVVDLEFVTQLTGYNIKHFLKYKPLIEEKFSSKYCKNIICWTEAAKKTLILNLDCKNFENKIEIVPLSVNKKYFIKKKNSEKIKLLFVGSANIPGEFEFKGGKEAVETFRLLQKKYPNLELVVRSDIPKELKEEYSKIKNLKIIDRIIPWSQLEEEFKTADIFLYPTHSTPGLAFLDAMSYELPIITTDVWANSEMVEDNKNGFLVEKSRNVKYYSDGFIPLWDYKKGSTFMISIQTTDKLVVQELVEKTMILIEDEALRKKMGRMGRKKIETGKFSINYRNKKLKKIFDEATE